MKLFPLFIICFYSAYSQETTGVYMKYAGTIGKKELITVDLLVTDSLITGHYYYNDSSDDISLTGTRRNEMIQLISLKDTIPTGYFDGRISADLSVVEGKWQDHSREKSYPFMLKSFLHAGSAGLTVFSKKFNYEWRKNEKGQSLGCSANYSYCCISNFTDKMVQKKINEVLLKTDLSGNETPSKETVISAMEDEFSTYTDNYNESFPDSIAESNAPYMNESPHIYTWKSFEISQVLFDENYILCVEDFIYDYTGGAHGNYGYSYQAFNLRTGELLELEDIFKADFRTTLISLIEEQLRKDRHIDEKIPLTKAGFLTDHLELNDLFYIQHDGIGFTYNPYEIASYGDGTIRILIRWEQLKPLIQPNGPLAWVLSH